MIVLFWIMGRALVGWVTGKFMSNERRYQVMDGVMGVADGVGDVRLQRCGLNRYVGGNLEYGPTD